MKVGRVYVSVDSLSSDVLNFKVAYQIEGRIWKQCHISYDLVREDFVNKVSAGCEMLEIRQRVKTAVEKIRENRNDG